MNNLRELLDELVDWTSSFLPTMWWVIANPKRACSDENERCPAAVCLVAAAALAGWLAKVVGVESVNGVQIKLLQAVIRGEEAGTLGVLVTGVLCAQLISSEVAPFLTTKK